MSCHLARGGISLSYSRSRFKTSFFLSCMTEKVHLRPAGPLSQTHSHIPPRNHTRALAPPFVLPSLPIYIYLFILQGIAFAGILLVFCCFFLSWIDRHEGLVVLISTLTSSVQIPCQISARKSIAGDTLHAHDAFSMDPTSPISPARVRVLLLPAGRIVRSRFLSFAKRLQSENVIRLSDISPVLRQDQSASL